MNKIVLALKIYRTAGLLGECPFDVADVVGDEAILKFWSLHSPCTCSHMDAEESFERAEQTLNDASLPVHAKAETVA